MIQDYLIAILVAAHLLAVNGCPRLLHPLVGLERPIQWIAGATFTLYLFHLPVAQFIAATLPGSPSASSHRIVVMGGTAIAVLVIAQVTERRKRVWRRMFVALLGTSNGSPKSGTARGALQP